MQAIGILGGTFDPVHFGHLRLAEEMRQCLGLSQVRFVPTGRPWHRGAPGATPLHRLEMLRVALADAPEFLVDDREVRTGAPGYSVDTLGELRRELGPNQPLCLLLGADAFLGLHTWKRWRDLFGLAHIAVAHRPGFSLAAEELDPALAAEVERRLLVGPRELSEPAAGLVVTCPVTQLEISSTAIRAQIGGGLSPRYLLPDGVLDYIRTQRLYR